MHNPSNNECPVNADPRNETCGCEPNHNTTVEMFRVLGGIRNRMEKRAADLIATCTHESTGKLKRDAGSVRMIATAADLRNMAREITATLVKLLDDYAFPRIGSVRMMAQLLVHAYGHHGTVGDLDKWLDRLPSEFRGQALDEFWREYGEMSKGVEA